MKQIPSLRPLGLLLSLCFLAASCATDGKYFKSEISWIKEGQTTQDQALSMLGEPYSIGNSSGSPTWTYGYYRYRLIGKSYTKELKFYWDEGKKVKSFSFNSSFPEDKAAVLPKSSAVRPGES